MKPPVPGRSISADWTSAMRPLQRGLEDASVVAYGELAYAAFIHALTLPVLHNTAYFSIPRRHAERP